MSGGGRISDEAVRAELDKILRSPAFERAERSARFLRYIVDQTLAGNARAIKEYALALEVFERNPDYDPHVDATVRVEASRIRKRIREYYESDGLRDAIRIDLPKGTYVPVFSETQSRSSNPRPLRRIIAVGTSAALLSTLAWVIWRPRSAPETSVSVLPFANAGSTADGEYLAEGLTAEIIGRLTAIPALHVSAPTSVFSFKGKQIDAIEIGHRLGTATVLDGWIGVEGGRVRINATLRSTKDSRVLWANHYEREMRDVFALEDEMALSIANALRLHLTDDEARRLAHRAPSSAEAYQLYLQGRYFWRNRNQYWNGGPMALDYFDQARRKDPAFAPAYAGMADYYNFSGMPDGLEKARQYARQALQLDRELAEAHASLGIVHMHSWNWGDAETEFRRALELNPGYSTGHLNYGQMLMFEGRFDAALQQVETARELDPVPSSVGVWVGQVHYFAGRYERALREFQNVLARDPDNAPARHCVGTAYARLGRYDEAIREFRRSLEQRKGGIENIRALIQVYAEKGDRQSALNSLQELERLSQVRRVSPWVFAHVYAVLGPPEKALAFLEQAYAEHETILVFMRIEPMMRSLRPLPRFQAILKRIGLSG